MQDIIRPVNLFQSFPLCFNNTVQHSIQVITFNDLWSAQLLLHFCASLKNKQSCVYWMAQSEGFTLLLPQNTYQNIPTQFQLSSGNVGPFFTSGCRRLRELNSLFSNEHHSLGDLKTGDSFKLTLLSFQKCPVVSDGRCNVLGAAQLLGPCFQHWVNSSNNLSLVLTHTEKLWVWRVPL